MHLHYLHKEGLDDRLIYMVLVLFAFSKKYYMVPKNSTEMGQISSRKTILCLSSTVSWPTISTHR